MLTVLLTFLLSLFGALSPLFLWIIDREKEKIKLHRFILGLSLASSIITIFLVFSLKISQISIITIFIWIILLATVTLYYWRKSIYSTIIISIPSIAGIFLIYNLASQLISPSPSNIFIILIGGLILSGSLFAMILGHWYLNVVNLPIGILRNATRLIMSLLIFRLIWNAFSIFTQKIMYDGFFLPLTEFVVTIDGIFLWVAILFGTMLPLILTFLALRTIDIHSTQSATGLLYVLVISVIMGDLFFKYYMIRYGLFI